MIKDLTLEEFLLRNHIDAETWEKAKIEWSSLLEIGSDHEAESAKLENSAEFFAKEIQKFNGVHSVRWRVKDSEHLATKIVRKRSESNPKYTDITLKNYYEIVTDLVGIRALHLFKENCFEIDSALNTLWNPIETTVAYIRDGDSEGMKKRFEDKGFEVKSHPAGYRSVHYIIESIPLKRKIIAEIQVRTIFEEGWSEIDHKIRYPNFSDNELVNYFLEIFNRMAGSADDMGGFVLGLVATLSGLQKEIDIIKEEKNTIFQEMEQALDQLESVKKQDSASKDSVAKLKAEISKLKELKHNDGGLGIYSSKIMGEGLLGSASIDDILGITAAQFKKGLMGSASPDDIFGSTVSERFKSGLLRSSTVNDILGLPIAEQARKGLVEPSTINDILRMSTTEHINNSVHDKSK